MRNEWYIDYILLFLPSLILSKSLNAAYWGTILLLFLVVVFYPVLKISMVIFSRAETAVINLLTGGFILSLFIEIFSLEIISLPLFMSTLSIIALCAYITYYYKMEPIFTKIIERVLIIIVLIWVLFFFRSASGFLNSSGLIHSSIIAAVFACYKNKKGMKKSE